MNNFPNEWQLQEAKNKLSQLVKAAKKGIPQLITVHGKSTAVVISAQEYERLKRPTSTLSSALLTPILDDDDRVFERNSDTGREINL
ncbi:MAG: type II toxin-antitoxin system Phd/YefM family antitoxin [Candidatus Competibacteraceae bacterium]|nr:type II toxin-antitoxin system Phd/YefM family antitoxin [Candidatus Competibacteraceae bacterium]